MKRDRGIDVHIRASKLTSEGRGEGRQDVGRISIGLSTCRRVWPTARYVAADKENRRESSRKRRRQGQTSASLRVLLFQPCPLFLSYFLLRLTRGDTEKSKFQSKVREGGGGGGKGRDRVQLMFFRCPLSSLLDGLLTFVESRIWIQGMCSIGVNCFPIKRIEMIPFSRLRLN